MKCVLLIFKHRNTVQLTLFNGTVLLKLKYSCERLMADDSAIFVAAKLILGNNVAKNKTENQQITSQSKKPSI